MSKYSKQRVQDIERSVTTSLSICNLIRAYRHDITAIALKLHTPRALDPKSFRLAVTMLTSRFWKRFTFATVRHNNYRHRGTKCHRQFSIFAFGSWDPLADLRIRPWAHVNRLERAGEWAASNSTDVLAALMLLCLQWRTTRCPTTRGDSYR